MDSKKSPKGRRRTTKLASGQSSGLLDAAGSVGPPGVASTSTAPGLEGTVCQTSGSVVETGEYFWDCSVCTFRNHAEAFKCSMCDVRKGTSTRKPKLNPELVAAQQSQSITPPPSSCTPTPSTSTGGTCGVVDTDPAPLPGLLKMGKKGKDSSKMPIKKPKEAKKITGPPRLKNVDRSSATYHSVTVNDITVVITEFQPKLKKPKLKKLPTAAAATVTSSSSPLVSSGASPAAGSLLPASSTTSSGGLVKPSMGDCSLPLQLM